MYKMAKGRDEYKNLKLNLNNLEGIVRAWAVETGRDDIRFGIKNSNKQVTNYLIKVDDKEVILAVYPNIGGVYSISPNFGTEKLLSEEIADYIVKNVGNLSDSNPYKSGLSIDISRDDFNAFIDLMKSQDNIVVLDEYIVQNNKIFIKLQNTEYRDSIAISYYKTGKLVIQGKMLELFCLAVEILSDRQELKTIVNAETKSAGVVVECENIIEDMKSSLGRAYEFLGNSHKAILASAYILYRTDYVCDNLKIDYSVFFYPASRVLEGFIFKLLVTNNVEHNEDEGLGYYFHGEHENNALKLRSEYITLIDNDIIVREINKLYKLFHRVRHPYSHATENDYRTAVITVREKTDKIFKEIIDTINNSYAYILEAKNN